MYKKWDLGMIDMYKIMLIGKYAKEENDRIKQVIHLHDYEDESVEAFKIIGVKGEKIYTFAREEE